MPLPATLLTGLRRQQLVDLARAYEVDIPAGATKRQMLPSMITAEQQGVFKRQPKHPFYLHKAGRTSDMPYIPLPENPEFEEASPVVEQPRQGGVKDPYEETRSRRDADPNAPRLTRTGRKESDYHRKQRLLKAKGINAFGWSKQAVNDEAAKNGIQ